MTIRAARERLGITQGDLAKELGVSGAAVSHYELGTRPIPLERLTACARILDAASLLLLVPTASRSPAGRDENNYDFGHRLFASKKITRWWADQTVEFLMRYDVTQSELDNARVKLGGYVALYVGQKEEEFARMSEDRLVKTAELFIPALTQSFEAQLSATGVAA